MPFQASARKSVTAAAALPKIKKAAKSSTSTATAPTTPSSSDRKLADDLNEPPINRGPLWSPLYRKAGALASVAPAVAGTATGAGAGNTSGAGGAGSATKMKPTSFLAAGPRTPLIKFLGKRSVPKSIDHTPHAHPAAPSQGLPDSFASYRSKAQQHGPLGGQGSGSAKALSGSGVGSASAAAQAVSPALGRIGGARGVDLGPVKPAAGEFFDRSELPRRFRKLDWSEEEIEAVNSGGATSIKSQLSYHFKL